jgi:hypothetical protein
MSWFSRLRRRHALAESLGYKRYMLFLLVGFPLVLGFVVFVEVATGGNPTNMAVWSAVIGLMLVLLPIYVLHRGRAVRLVEEIDAHRDELLHGKTIRWRDHELALETELTSYEITVSVVFWTIRIPTAFSLASEPSPTMLWSGQLLTAVFGWWGIPFGPFLTVGSLWRNARGGYRTSVAQLLTDMVPST